MSPEDLERLAAEAVPTGTFGGPRVTVPAPLTGAKPHREPPPDPQAARHRAELLAALDGHLVGRPRHRHLRAVPNATTPTRKAS